MRFEPLWGEFAHLHHGRVRLTAPVDVEPIGSALTLMQWSSRRQIGVTGSIVEQYSTPELGMGPWFLLGCRPTRRYPAVYLRLRPGSWELGWCDGQDPEHQVIAQTVNGESFRNDRDFQLRLSLDLEKERLAFDGIYGHLAAFNTRALSLEREIHWASPWLGLYCEGCMVELQLLEDMV